jgi:hypothetical protein
VKSLIIAASVVGAVVVGFVAVVLIVQMAESRHSDPRLFGTWKSDGDATVAEVKKTRTLSDEQEQKLNASVGKMRITYTATTLTTDVDGAVESQSYQVVRKDADSVTIKAWSPLTKEEVNFHIRFDGTDTYWVDFPSGKGSECFRRVG